MTHQKVKACKNYGLKGDGQMLNQMIAIIRREIKLGLLNGGGAFLPSAFFAGSVLILPFALGKDPIMLKMIGAGFLWLTLALSSLVSLERLYQSDFDDGTLEQYFLIDLPLPIIVLAKIIGAWLSVCVPLIAIVPICAIMLNITSTAILPIMLQIFIGSLSMFLMGAIGAALGVSIKRGGLLIALLILPLYTPIIIFGAASAQEILNNNLIFSQGFLFIIAICLSAIVIAPIIISSILKLNID